MQAFLFTFWSFLIEVDTIDRFVKQTELNIILNYICF